MERRNWHPVRVPQSPSPDRRAATRFALTLEVSYSLPGGGAPAETGSGRTIDLSSSGLSFTTGRPLVTGQKLALSIDWPVLLDGAIKLQLVMSGVVVRTNGTVAALRITRHEFRTRRAVLRAVAPEKSVG